METTGCFQSIFSGVSFGHILHEGRLMRGLPEIGVIVLSIIAGLILGGFVPEELLPKSWRQPIGALLVGVGLVLAVIALS